MVVSGLGRDLVSSSHAATRGVSTVIEPGNPHLKRKNIVAPLQQPDEDMGLCSFQVNLGATHNRDNAATSHPPEENRTMVTEQLCLEFYRLHHQELHLR